MAKCFSDNNLKPEQCYGKTSDTSVWPTCEVAIPTIVTITVRWPFNNHRSLFFRILAHTRLYRTERTLELTVPSQFVTVSFYVARICKDRSTSSALFDVLILIFRHSYAEFVWVICARLGSFPISTIVLRFCMLSHVNSINIEHNVRQFQGHWMA